MPILSGKQMGSTRMSMQSKKTGSDTSSKSVSSMQKRTTASPGSGILTGDSLNTQSKDGALLDYTNPDLETIISSLGFSTQRPAMLAAFEYLPFLDEDTLKTSKTSISEKSISTTSAAELADLHSQLKQLRYSEALEFLEKYTDVKTRRALGGRKLVSTAENEKKNLLETYSSTMSDAKSIIDALTEIYNAILPVLEAMQIKTNDYTSSDTYSTRSGSRRASASSTPARTIGKALSQKIYNNGWVKSSVIGDMSIEEYYQDYLNLKSILWELSSGSLIFTQLMLDVIMRLFYPLYGYSPESSSSSGGIHAAGSNEEYGNLKGLAFVEETRDVGSILDRLTHINYKNNHINFSSSATTGTSTQDSGGVAGAEFTSGDFKRLWNKFAPGGDADLEDSKIDLGRALYMVGSDIMAFHALRSDNYDLSDYISGASRSTAGSDIMKTLFGTSVRFSEKNVADLALSSAAAGRALAGSFPKNNDSSTKGKVSAFSYAQNALPSGKYPMRTGKSYYIDEIFTGEMGDVKRRLSQFQQDLSEIRSNLINTSEIMKNPSHSATGVSVAAPELTKRMYLRAENQVIDCLEKLSEGKWKHWCRMGVYILAADNVDLAWQLFKFYTALNGIRGSGLNLTQTVTSESAQSDIDEMVETLTSTPGSSTSSSSPSEPVDVTYEFFNQLIQDIAKQTIKSFPGYRGEATAGTVPDPWDSAPSYGEHSFIAAGSADWDDDATDTQLFTVFSADDSEHFGLDHISEAFWGLLQDASGNSGEAASSPNSAFTFGFEGLDDFIQYNEVVYGSQRFTASGNNTTPLFNINYDGAVALSFFFQLQVWKTFKLFVVPQEFAYTTENAPDKDWWSAAANAAAATSGGAALAVGTTDTLDVYTPGLYEDVGYDYASRGPNTYVFGRGKAKALQYATGAAVEQVTSPDDIQVNLDAYDAEDIWGKVRDNGTIDEYLDDISMIYWKQAESEANLWNSLWFVNGIIQEMYSAVSKLLSTLEGNSISGGTFDSVFNKIVKDKDLKKTLFISLTRDQLSLNSALYDSLSTTNRKYPYLPATKAVMPNQMKNLATMSTLGVLVDTVESGKKRILMIGIPSGFMDRLRNEAIDSGKGLGYYKSTIISVKVWRRNMADDSEITVPKEFRFDMSKFIIEGRRRSTQSGSKILDAASETEDGQSAEDVFNNTVVTTYQPEHVGYATQGAAYSSDTLNSSTTGTQVFQNLVLDYYLKLYVKLTSGFDISEEIFPLQFGKLFFEGPDVNKRQVFAKLKKELAESFPTKSVTASINYDRLLGELTRSILLSPSKWSNRVFYPKTFERIFCVLIDESDFSTQAAATSSSDTEVGYDMDYVVDVSTGNVDYGSSSSSSIIFADRDERTATYYQFYCTASLLSAMTDSQEPDESSSDASTVLSSIVKTSEGYSNLLSSAISGMTSK